MLRMPPQSISQGEFFRVRERGKELYSSSCYAIPKTSCLIDKKKPDRNVPISFVGVDIAVFKETDPPTKLGSFSEEVAFRSSTHVQTCDQVSSVRRRSSIVMESEETSRNDEILSRLDEEEDDDDDFFGSRRSVGGSEMTAIKKKSGYTSIPVS